MEDEKREERDVEGNGTRSLFPCRKNFKIPGLQTKTRTEDIPDKTPD
jgi:hypothetical protein